jgi:hypothetical protein
MRMRRGSIRTIIAGEERIDLQDRLAEFLTQHPNPSKEELKTWIKANNWKADYVIEELSRLAAQQVSFLYNGEWVKSKKRMGEVDPKQLKLGIKIEMEHTSNPMVAKRIALDHLAEIKDYYTRLVKMEEEAKGKTASARLAGLPKGDTIRSSFFPEDIASGTKLYVIQSEHGSDTLFTIATKFEIYGYTTDVKKATDAFEGMLVVDDASQIKGILKKHGIKSRKPRKAGA